MKPIIIGGLCLSLATLAGCAAPMVPNPYSEAHEPVSSDRLFLERERHEAKIARQAEESKIEATEKLDAKRSDYELAVAEIESEMQSRLRVLASTMRAGEREALSANHRASAILASALAESKASFESASEAIERQWATREGFASILQSPGSASLAGLVPGLGALWPALATGAGGLILGSGRRRKAVDAAYVEGQTDTEKEVEKRNKEWADSQAETIKMLLATGGGSLNSLLKPSAAPTTPSTT